MKILKISRDKYIQMCERMHKNLGVTFYPGETQGMSKQEREEYLYKKFNPDIPMYVDYHGKRGTIRIIPKKDIMVEYQMIKSYYGNRTTKRSGVKLINHIDEGLEILNNINASDKAKRAYCLHPCFQEDKDLLTNSDIVFLLDPYVIMLVMEYRSTANNYLSYHGPSRIKLSPIKEVNDMLIADKIQNYTDFMAYHYGTHPRSEELLIYFMNWFEELGLL